MFLNCKGPRHHYSVSQQTRVRYPRELGCHNERQARRQSLVEDQMNSLVQGANQQKKHRKEQNKSKKYKIYAQKNKNKKRKGNQYFAQKKGGRDRSQDQFGQDNEDEDVEPAEEYVGGSLFKGQTFCELENIEKYPELYDLTYGYRDYGKEADFLYEVHEEVNKSKPRLIMELGCTPCRHGIDLIDSDARVVLVNSNKHMVAYIQRVLEASQLPTIPCVHSPLDSFQLRDNLAGKVDLAFMINNELNKLLNHGQILGMLKSTWRALAPGGLLILSGLHPLHMFDGTVTAGGRDGAATSSDQGCVVRQHFQMQEAEVLTAWGGKQDELDPISQIYTRQVVTDVDIKSAELVPVGVSNRCVSITSRMHERWYTYQELSLLATMAGFNIVRQYSQLDLKSLQKVPEGINDTREALADCGVQLAPWQAQPVGGTQTDVQEEDQQKSLTEQLVEQEGYKLILVLQKG